MRNKSTVLALILFVVSANAGIGFSFAIGTFSTNGSVEYVYNINFSGVSVIDNEFDIDVANTVATIINTENIQVTITNAYPGYIAYVSFTIQNTGTGNIVLNLLDIYPYNTDALSVEMSGIDVNDFLIPGQTAEGLVTITVLQNSAMNSDYPFYIDIGFFEKTSDVPPPPPPPPPPPSGNKDPIADASAGGPYYGFIGEDIDFDGSNSYDPDSDGYIVSWHWDFDDGTGKEGETVTHNYSSDGTYHVTLTVTDNKGAKDKDTFNVIIIIANYPPENLEVDGPLAGKQNIDYDYTASATDSDDDDMLRFIFEWGDGTSTTSDVVDSGVAATVTHKWTTYGVYKVKVTAQDNFSAQTSTTFSVLIDVIVIDEEIKGLIIDEDGNDPFDIFNNSETKDKTKVVLDSGSYLIDSNGDTKWDYAFNFNTGLITYYEFVYNKYIVIYELQKAAPGFELIFALLAIALMVLIIRRKRKLS